MATTTPTDAELDAMENRLQMDWPSIDDAIEAAAALAALRRERDAAMDVNFRVLRRAKSAERQVETLREALKDATAHLVAATSLLARGGKKAAPSGKMFAQMLVDYQTSADRARAALAETEKTDG